MDVILSFLVLLSLISASRSAPVVCEAASCGDATLDHRGTLLITIVNETSDHDSTNLNKSGKLMHA